MWLLTEADNALSHTGQVDNLRIRLEPQPDLTGGIQATVGAFSFLYFYIDVPPNATNLTINIVNNSATPLPLQLLVRRGTLPTLTTFDKQATILPPGGSLSIGKSDLPPLQPGRYFIGVYNPNNISQDFFISAQLDLDLNGAQTVNFTSANTVPILDDAVTYDTMDLSSMPANVDVFSVNVGVAIQHPRISDLVLTLISPSGTRTLLMENRGGTGSQWRRGKRDDDECDRIQQRLRQRHRNSLSARSDGGRLDGRQAIKSAWSTIRPTRTPAAIFWRWRLAALARTVTTVPGQTYTLTYAYRGPGIVGMWRGENNAVDSIAGNNGIAAPDVVYTAAEVGQGFGLGSTNAYIRIPASQSLNVGLGAGFTVDAWIYPSNIGNWHPIMEWNNGSHDGIGAQFWIDPSGALLMNIVDSAGPGHLFTSAPNTISASSFQHVALDYDHNSGIATMYRNGVAVLSGNIGSFFPLTSYDIFWGRRPAMFLETPHMAVS